MIHANYIGKTINDLMKDNSFGSFAIGFYMVTVDDGKRVCLNDILNNEELLNKKIKKIIEWCDWDFWIELETGGNDMSIDSRFRQLESDLTKLGFEQSLKALDLMVKEMCAEKGFTRHNGDHYYIHLIDVAQDLINYGVREEDVITAALLHDYREDVSDVTIKMIEYMFNSRVATLVDNVTKDPDAPEGTYKGSGILIHINKAGSDYGSALIKAGDRKNNFSKLKDAPIEKRHKQAIETEFYYLPAFKEWRRRYPRWVNYFLSAQNSIIPHLDAIKELVNLNQQVKYLTIEVNQLNSIIKEISK
jgi:GTP pyrophosphokinase